MTNLQIAERRISDAISRNLNYLNLSCLGLDRLPDNIKDLNSLIEIDLSHNNFKNVPDILSYRNDILKINFSNNLLIDFDWAQGRNHFLQFVNIENNQLNYIPDSLLTLDSNCSILFEGNPFLRNLPDELIWKEDIHYISFFLDSFKNQEIGPKLFESKIILVGKGGVGKTSLAKKIRNPNINLDIGNEESTHGINIFRKKSKLFFPAKKPYYRKSDLEDMYVKNITRDFDEDGIETENYNYVHIGDYEWYNEDDYIELHLTSNPISQDPRLVVEKEVAFNIWDFGGQEIYYSTHQFFLTKNSIYILVWDSRSDLEQESLKYWLETINRISPKSPIIVNMNKSDVRFKSIDENSLIEEYSQIVSFNSTSCENNEGIKDLLESIYYATESMPHIGTLMPETWEKIRDNLKKLGKDFINLDTFSDICSISNDEKLSYLSSYLHDIGDIIHYKDDFRLKDLIILNPEWLTKAIYELIKCRDIQKNQGYFTINILEDILDKKIYPSHKFNQIISLMIKFQICFKIIGESEKYLIPTLLNANKPNLESFYGLQNENCSSFKIKYSIIAFGIIERLICRLHRLIQLDKLWKNGALFVKEQAQAIVIQQINNYTVLEIIIKGFMSHDLYSIIKDAIDSIHFDLNIDNSDFAVELQCNCRQCVTSKEKYYFDQNILLTWLNKEKKFIPCQLSTENVEIRDLLSGYKRESLELGILQEIIVQLSNMQGQKFSLKDYTEDQLNSYLSLLIKGKLVINNLYPIEQSRKGQSASLKSVGELDLSIENFSGQQITIFEGLKLKSLNDTYIKNHIDKLIYNYDTQGLREKYLGVYCYIGDFQSFAQKYLRYLESYNFNDINFTEVADVSNIYSQGSELKVFKTAYKKNKVLETIYHILVNFQIIAKNN